MLARIRDGRSCNLNLSNTNHPPSATLGAIGYEAYAVSTGGKTFDGRDMPKWHDLPHRIQEAWEASALAILAEARCMAEDVQFRGDTI